MCYITQSPNSLNSKAGLSGRFYFYLIINLNFEEHNRFAIGLQGLQLLNEIR